MWELKPKTKSRSKKLKAINCPIKLNSGAIDEFLIIFLVAAKASGVSYFKNIGELNQKESPRLKWGAKILNKMGIKTITTDSSIKIFGNPNLKITNLTATKFARQMDHGWQIGHGMIAPCHQQRLIRHKQASR